MGEVIVITSGKGGVGKTTVTANIGLGLANLNKKVVVVDTDIGLRNLDVVLGLENRIVYNLIDVIEGSCRMKQALIRDKHCENLYLLPSAQTRDKTSVKPEQMVKLTKDLAEEFDYILLDCPAGIEDGFHFAVSAADRAVVVTSPHISAVRDAGRVICLLDGMRLSQIDLLINAYNARMVRKHDMLSQKDVEDILGLSAIGVIPADERIVVSQNKGIPVLSMHTKATRAFMTAARAFANPRVIPVDLNKEDPCIRQGKIYLGGKECEYEG